MKNKREKVLFIGLMFFAIALSGCTETTPGDEVPLDLTTFDIYGDQTGFTVQPDKIMFDNIPESQVFCIKKEMPLTVPYSVNFKLKLTAFSMPQTVATTGPTVGMMFTNEANDVRMTDVQDGDDCFTFDISSWNSTGGTPTRLFRIHDNTKPWSGGNMYTYKQYSSFAFDTEYDITLDFKVGLVEVTCQDTGTGNYVWVASQDSNVSATVNYFSPFIGDGYGIPGNNFIYSGEIYDLSVTD